MSTLTAFVAEGPAHVNVSTIKPSASCVILVDGEQTLAGERVYARL